MKKFFCLIVITLMSANILFHASASELFEAENLGHPLYDYTLSSCAAAFEYNGEDYYFAPINGGKLYVYNIDTKTQTDVEETGITTPWGCTLDSKGNVYISGNNNFIYKYNIATGTGAKMDVFSDTATNAYSIIADENDNLYWGSFPDGKIYKYDATTGEYSDYGILHENAKYVRSLVYYNGYIYANIYGSSGSGIEDVIVQIVKINPDNPEDKIYIDVKNSMAKPYMIATMSLAGNVIICGGDDNMIAIDTNTDQLIDIGLSDGITGIVSPEKDGKVYFPIVIDGVNYFCTFDVDTRQITKQLSGGGYSHAFYMYGDSWVTINGYDRILTVRPLTGDPILYNPTNGYKSPWENFIYEAANADENPGAPIVLNSIGNGPKGSRDLYLGGFRKMDAAVYNLETGGFKETVVSGNQTDAILSYNNKIYFGTYTGAVLREYNPGTETTTEILRLDNGEEQTRIHTLSSGDNKVFFGTIPDYGCLGGGIGWYDISTGETYFERNIVTDQSVNCVVYHNGYLYGTTSVTGGGGTTPTQSEAKIFVYDVANKKLVKTFTPSIFGISKPPYIAGISVDDSGVFWGVVSGTLFTFDPDTEKCEEKLSLSKTAYPSGNSRNLKPLPILFGKDGCIYVSFGATGGIWRINSKNTSDYQKISDETIINYTFGDDGNLYFTTSTYMKKLQLVPEISYMQSVLGNALAIKTNSEYSYVNGSVMKIDSENTGVTPIVENCRAFLPLRFIAENFGCSVLWNKDSTTVTLTKDDLSLKITIGAETMKMNGKTISLSAPAMIRNDRTMLPVRDIALAFDKEVYHNDGVVILSDEFFTLTASEQVAAEIFLANAVK